jgi:hypothetical protein
MAKAGTTKGRGCLTVRPEQPCDRVGDRRPDNLALEHDTLELVETGAISRTDC